MSAAPRRIRGRRARKQNVTRSPVNLKGGDPDAEKSTLPADIMQAGLNISVTHSWIFSVVFAIVATITVKLMGYSCLSLYDGNYFFMGVPRLVIKRLKMRRQKKFLRNGGFI